MDTGNVTGREMPDPYLYIRRTFTVPAGSDREETVTVKHWYVPERDYYQPEFPYDWAEPIDREEAEAMIESQFTTF